MKKQRINIDQYKLIDVSLMKRYVLKRCVYGVDLNPMAVELSKVSLWLDCFTLGAPLSFLDHHLKCGNSLIGTNLERAREDIETGQMSLWSESKFGGIEEASKEMIHVGELSDITTDMVEESRESYEKAIEALEPYKRMLDVYTSRWFSNQPETRKKGRKKVKFDYALEFLQSGEVNDWLENPDNTQMFNDDQKDIVDSAMKDYQDYRFFHWELEFPEIFYGEEGSNEELGFDAVVGNPPYIPWYKFKENYKHLKRGFFKELSYNCRPNHNDAQPNIYLFFQILGIELLKNNGCCSFIIPQEWLERPKAQDFRDYFLKKSNINMDIFPVNFKVFKNSNETIGTNSLIVFHHKIMDFDESQKVISRDIITTYENEVKEYLKAGDNTYIDKKTSKKNLLYGEKWIFEDINKLLTLISKKNNISILESSDFEVGGGFQPPIKLLKYYTIDEEDYNILNELEKKYVYPAVINASKIKRYIIEDISNFWIVLNEFNNLKDAKDKIPRLVKWLEPHQDKLKNDHDDWWMFPRERNFDKLKDNKEKLLTPRTSDINSFALDKKGVLFKGTNSFIYSKCNISNKALLGVLNSKLLTCWYTVKGSDYHGSNRYEPGKVKKLPIKIQGDELEHIKNLVNSVTKKKEEMFEEKSNFLAWISGIWDVEIEDLKLKTSLLEYWKYDFDEMLRVVRKNRSSIQKNTRSELFEKNLKEKWQKSMDVLIPLMEEIQELENEIDAFVFKLYDLDEEEIEIVLDSLETEEEIKEDILEKFRDLPEENDDSSNGD
ncbi:MAG: Eco57I restriction-modification methylase domain-containing protein [Thermoplasmatota archaeon]